MKKPFPFGILPLFLSHIQNSDNPKQFFKESFGGSWSGYKITQNWSISTNQNFRNMNKSESSQKLQENASFTKGVTYVSTINCISTSVVQVYNSKTSYGMSNPQRITFVNNYEVIKYSRTRPTEMEENMLDQVPWEIWFRLFFMSSHWETSGSNLYSTHGARICRYRASCSG